MDGITVGQIASAIGLIAGIITGIGVIVKVINTAITKTLQSNLKPLEDKIDNIDMNVCKNYVIEYIGEEKRGVEHTDTETRLFWDNYDRYIRRGGNSYVKEEVEKLKKENKI